MEYPGWNLLDLAQTAKNKAAHEESHGCQQGIDLQRTAPEFIPSQISSLHWKERPKIYVQTRGCLNYDDMNELTILRAER